ncbi:MAG: hypothetical protein AAGL98_01820 [Planctomycetota bacterium]
MAIMQIVGVVAVLDGGVAAVGAVLVVVVFVRLTSHLDLRSSGFGLEFQR